MSHLRIPPVAAQPLAVGKLTAPPARAADPAMKKACEAFESTFLRQLLHAAKIGGKDADHGYGAMAVDALASGIQAGGGLGLASAIEKALARHDDASHPHAPAATRKP